MIQFVSTIEFRTDRRLQLASNKFYEYCATEILNEHFPNDPWLLFVVVETDELWTLWNYEEYNVSIIFDYVSNRFQ